MIKSDELIEAFITIGEEKTKASIKKLLILAVFAGFFIGMGGVVANTASYAIENSSVSRIICGLLFPFGLFMVIVTGSELFTGNCLITISLLSHRIDIFKMLKNLSIVYVGNFIGAIVLAACYLFSGQMNLTNEALAVTTIKNAVSKCSLSFGSAVLLGILCNILVCTAVMCAACAKDMMGKAIAVVIPVSFFVISGFEHCVANMYYIPAGLFALHIPAYVTAAESAGVITTSLTWCGFLLHNLLPVTLGNLIGGCGFASLIWMGHHTEKKGSI